MDALRRSALFLGDRRDAQIFAITILEQLAIAGQQLRRAFRQRVAAAFDLIVPEGFVRFDQEQIELIGKVQLLPAPRPQEIGDLETSDAAGPGEETAIAIVLAEFLPQDER